jgi:hypothetical protein
MIVLLELFYAAVHVALTGLLHWRPGLAHGLLVGGHAESGVHAHTIPVLPVLATLALVAFIMAVAKGAELVGRLSERVVFLPRRFDGEPILPKRPHLDRGALDPRNGSRRTA